MFKPRITLVLVTFLYCFTIHADNVSDLNSSYNNSYSPSVHGGIGLIQTPTARFSANGDLSFGLSSETPFNRLYGKMQFLPWFEAVVKYAEETSNEFNSTQSYKDKGFDLKIRLLQESDKLPQIALGLTDFAGTGLFSSEYIVASKALNNVDLSIGLGWGRLGGEDHISNPLGWFVSSKKQRGGWKDKNNKGGNLTFKRYFSGEKTSVFGGLEYFTPIENLSLKIEYDTSDFSEWIGLERFYDETGDILERDSRINYAISYRFQPSERGKVDLDLGYVRGNTIYANVAFTSNLDFSGTPKRIIGAEKIRNTNLPGGDYFSTLNKNRQNFLFNRTIRELANLGFVTHKVRYKKDELSAEISQNVYLDISHAIDLASRVLANNSPRNIKKITVINVDNGIETLRSTVLREDLVKSVSMGPLDNDLVNFNLADSIDDEIVIENDILYPNFFWQLKPRLNHTFQHQQNFFFWQVEAHLHTVYSVKQGLYLTTDIGINIDSNFEKYTYHVPDGELHYVRQDRRKYLKQGDTGIRRMALDYYADLHPNFKASFTIGYIEWMFGGIGGEVLYTPDSKTWALGVDAHWVKQREFDQKFSFQDYETLTGFVSYYQDIPFYDTRLKLSVGKFLGKDVGALIDISRRFESGARVGGFVTLTDCDPECVGEGSFHKGIYFELPMDLFYIQSTTRDKTAYSWSPLTKNAGARLTRVELYEVVTDVSDEVDQLRRKQWSFKKVFSGFGTKPKEMI